MIHVQVIGEKLATMLDNDMVMYHTPGEATIYWSSRPRFADDVCVGTVQDFLDQAGYTELDDSLMDEVFDIALDIGAI